MSNKHLRLILINDKNFNQDDFNQDKKSLNLRCHLTFKDENNARITKGDFSHIYIKEKTTLELFEMTKNYFVPIYLEASHYEKIFSLTYQDIIPKLGFTLKGIKLTPLKSFMRSPDSLGKMITCISKHCFLISFGFDMESYNCTQKV